MELRASLALVGDDIEPARDVCIFVDDQGNVESIEGWGSCPQGAAGGSWAVVLPQPANAHVHSADGGFPEFGVDLGLHELVAPPDGLKYRMLSTLSGAELVASIARTYYLAYKMGVGLLVDFREGGGEGCQAAHAALRSTARDLELLVLGTPGPGFPEGCDGLGVSSPLDYPESLLRQLTSLFPVSMTHVAEDPNNWAQGDLQEAIRSGFKGIVHGTYLTSEELEAVRDRGVGLVMCPRSNLWHGLRAPPVADAIRLGVTLGLGSDNAAWSVPEPWSEAELALLLARSQGLKSPLASRGVLRALFVGGYRVVGREPRTIVEGRRLHSVIVDGASTGILAASSVEDAIIKRSRYGLAYRLDGVSLDVLGLRLA